MASGVAGNDRSDAQRRLLITGASGRIGRMLVSAWHDRYDLRLTDVRPWPGRATLPFVQGDAASLAFMLPLCNGVDTVIHLAGLPSPLTPRRQLHHHNVRSTWATLKAAREQGCRRVVFASSIMIHVPPLSDYARAKIVGEQLGYRYASDGRLSVINLRVGRVMHPRDRRLWPGLSDLRYVVTDDDATSAFTLAVEAPPSLHAETFAVISANREPQVDIGETRRRLGYAPQADAFELADRVYRSPWGWLKRAKRWMMGPR